MYTETIKHPKKIHKVKKFFLNLLLFVLMFLHKLSVHFKLIIRHTKVFISTHTFEFSANF